MSFLCLGRKWLFNVVYLFAKERRTSFLILAYMSCFREIALSFILMGKAVLPKAKNSLNEIRLGDNIYIKTNLIVD